MITSSDGLLRVIWNLLNANVTIESFIEAITIGTILGIPIGISAALAAGGATSLRHYLLRCFLAWCGLLPWKLQHFLDYATERVFLSRVGGGYIFYHRLLMEYLVTTKETSYGSARYDNSAR